MGQADFREYFDLRRLDERQLGQIEFVLSSPAYEEAFKPYLIGVLASLNSLWKDRSEQRKKQYPDEFLAGGVIFGEGLLKFFTLILHESSMERIHAAMSEMTNEKFYDLSRQQGRVRPVVGIDQPAMPEQQVDPEEF